MNEWLLSNNVSEELKDELRTYDENKLNIAINHKVEFGTAGIRGTMGAGYGYINENIINWVTIGYAKYLNNNFKNPKIVIAYDNRKNSKYFAKICSNVLSNHNVEVFIFSKLKSTPQLSFTIRMLNASGGINITASHNPKVDNGYKLYNEYGGQYLPNDIEGIKNFINEISSPIDTCVYSNSNEKLITILDDDSEFTNFIKNKTNVKFKNYEKILISPLHGCGQIIKSINEKVQFKNVFYVEDQMDGDENFTTAPEPNPDSKKAYEFAIKNNFNNCNYIIANDPDADRVGIYDVKNDYLFSGNQIATLLVDYLITTKQFKKNQILITSNVSSTLPLKIAKKHDIKTEVVLTGFKWIGDIMHDETYFMGYEESNGYLTHTKTRDKDGITTAFKLIEMINYYFNNCSSLKNELERIYAQNGYYLEEQLNIFVDDISIVNNIISSIDFNSFENILFIEDFNKGSRIFKDKSEEISLPKNNMIKVEFTNGNWFAIRPSGTEPKIKVYCNTVGNSYNEAKDGLDVLKAKLKNIFK